MVVDVLEFLTDCVMAGKARSGDINEKYFEISDELLKKAFVNTYKLLASEVEVEK